jgi:hypothetical protein
MSPPISLAKNKTKYVVNVCAYGRFACTHARVRKSLAHTVSICLICWAFWFKVFLFFYLILYFEVTSAHRVNLSRLLGILVSCRLDGRSCSLPLSYRHKVHGTPQNVGNQFFPGFSLLQQHTSSVISKPVDRETFSCGVGTTGRST